MSIQLNACRFCGKYGQEEQMALDHRGHHAGWHVICHPCGATGPFAERAEDAVALWNGGLSEAASCLFVERRRQIDKEGYTPEHDDEHGAGELAGAAACYALWDVMHWAARQGAKEFWPWSLDHWKPGDHRDNLVKAGALILAEIERIDRAASKGAS